MSIRAKIQLSLAIVLILHISTAVMGHFGLQQAQTGFEEIESVNQNAVHALEIDRTVAEIQRTVAVYMLTGHATSADRVRELVEAGELQLALAASQSSDIDSVSWLESMATRLEQYKLSFEKVAIDRAARDLLVNVRMPDSRILALQSLNEYTKGDSDNNEQALLAIDNLLLAEISTHKYFDKPSQAYIEQSLEYLANSRQAASELGGTESSDIFSHINKYEDDFLSAVRSTRGYLHLVNVVLAGQAAELLYESAHLRMKSLERREGLITAMKADADRFQYFSNVVAVCTVITGIFIASIMTRSVLKPINHITSVLQKLALGESTESIGNSTRSDEIGKMASAAEVFRRKNIQTESLLVESQRLSTDLEQRNNEMTQFVYTVSHDLKSPLVTIKGFAGVLNEIVESGSQEDLTDITARIQGAAERMTLTIEDLLELSRIGIVVHERADVSLSELCNDIIEDMNEEIQRADARIELDPDLPTIVADRIRIRQVLQNLVQNAIKHGTTEGSPAEIKIAAVRTSNSVAISVSDKGPGIDHRYAEKVFGIFQRLNHSVSGNGVGLAIVRKIAEAHGGRAWVESELGEGATFFVEISDQNCVNASAA